MSYWVAPANPPPLPTSLFNPNVSISGQRLHYLTQPTSHHLKRIRIYQPYQLLDHLPSKKIFKYFNLIWLHGAFFYDLASVEEELESTSVAKYLITCFLTAIKEDFQVFKFNCIWFGSDLDAVAWCHYWPFLRSGIAGCSFIYSAFIAPILVTNRLPNMVENSSCYLSIQLFQMVKLNVC